MPATEHYAYENGWYVQTVSERAKRRLKSYTAFCAEAEASRGDYGEEVDVRAMGPAPAKRIVADVLAKDYVPGMKVRRLVFRPEGFLFF